MKLGIFDLVGMIMLVLTGTSFIYLLWIKNKSPSTRMLLWFFLCVILSALTTIITNIGTTWDWAFAPAQDALLILGGVFLVRFAYLYPHNDQPREASWVVSCFLILAMAAMTYAVIFAIRYVANLPGDLNENQYYYLITPLTIGLGVFVFFRRSLHWSDRKLNSNQKETHLNLLRFKYLGKPYSRPAIALRNYGLSLAIALIPVVVVVLKSHFVGVIGSFLFNFGAVIAIAMLMLTYFNYAPESVTISAKLVGISLVSDLLILGLAGVWIFETNPDLNENTLVLTFIALVLLSSLLIILVFPIFFRTVLLDPLANIIKGVKIANAGDLSIQVPVQYDDEIGFLTRSFNHMMHSLNKATLALKDESALLEQQVAERTAKLSQSNQELISENIERKKAESQLNRQWRYEHALAVCSQSLLLPAGDEDSQRQVLNQALEQLRAAALASRAYIFHNFQDLDLGLCMGMLAEVCASNIPAQINNPANQKFPWVQLPHEMREALQAGEFYGGPVERSFASTPGLRDILLQQENPLLSMQCLPIFFEDQWWGFVGFDDCENTRIWDAGEILLLRTASEMIGNTLQRWEVEKRLHENLDLLEQRVQERTMEYARVNANLCYEIHEREILQQELEERLEVEMTLARISARLLSPIELVNAIQETMADLGQMMQAKQVTFFRLQDNSNDRISDFIEWHTGEQPPLPKDQIGQMITAYPGFSKRLKTNKSIYIDDFSTLPIELDIEPGMLRVREIRSLILVPVFIDDRLAGIISFSNPELPKPKGMANIPSIEVIAGMLASLLSREEILNTLEEKVSTRTRELSAFFDMTMLAGEVQQLADFMQPALVKVMEIIACKTAAIHLFDEDQQRMTLVAHYGIPPGSLSQIESFPIDKGMRKWIENLSDGNKSTSNANGFARFDFTDFSTAAYVALRAKGNIQGLMSCFRLEDVPFDPYQKIFLNAIGEVLGMAVENYRLRLKAEKAAIVQERQRLARELHDAVSQTLYSLTLYAHSGKDAFEAGDRIKLMNSLEEIEINSLGALKEMRLLLYELRPLALEEKGLAQAIESRFNLVERRSGIQASINMEEHIELSENVEQELFLLITEALNNALKHAQANQVSVGLQIANGNIVLEVQDNGSGFDPSQVQGGMGLMNMQERAASLGGHIVISNQKDRGTCIRLEIPTQGLLMQEGYYE